jgi:hypothetical protein
LPASNSLVEELVELGHPAGDFLVGGHAFGGQLAAVDFPGRRVSLILAYIKGEVIVGSSPSL